MANKYPKDLFHATEKPVIAKTVEEEEAFRRKGFGDNYIKHEYPKTLYHETHTTKAPQERIVETPAEHFELGPGWDEVPPPQAPEVPGSAVVDQLALAQQQAMRVEVENATLRLRLAQDENARLRAQLEAAQTGTGDAPAADAPAPASGKRR